MVGTEETLETEEDGGTKIHVGRHAAGDDRVCSRTKAILNRRGQEYGQNP